MDLVLQRDPVQTREPDFAEISQKLRRLGRDMKSLSDTQPDFLKRLESLRNELDSIASQLRRANSI